MRGGKVEIPIELNTKGFDAQINDAINKLDTLEQEYEVLKNAKPYAGQKEDLIEYEKKIEQTSNRIIQLRQQQEKMEKSTTKSWDSVGKSIKKVGLKMFGLASIYSIVSKASSAYLSKDTELAEQLQNVWVSLGAFLAPAIEFITNLLNKAVGYLNVFIKELTGVDLIARANAKALKKQAQAQKQLNKQMYDFDVIRTQQDESTGTSSTSGAEPMIKTPELNSDFVNAIKDIAKAVVGLYEKFVGPFKELNKEQKEFEKSLNTETHIVESNTQGIKNWTKAYWDTNKAKEGSIESDILMRESLKKTSNEIKNNIEDVQKQKKQWFLSKAAKQELINKETEYAKELSVVNTNYKMLYEQNLLNDDATKDYIESLKTQIEVAKDLGFETGELEQQLSDLENKKYTAKVEVQTDFTIADKVKQATAELAKTNPSIAQIDTWLKTFGSTKKYAVGGIVTQPTRAIIGEAGYNEYVIPEREDYIGRLASLINQHSGGGTTNVYLDGRLIQRQINDKQNQYNFSTNR